MIEQNFLVVSPSQVEICTHDEWTRMNFNEGKCKSAELLAAIAKMFDWIGGLGRVAKRKTVAVKVNLTGEPARNRRKLGPRASRPHRTAVDSKVVLHH